MSTPLLPSLRNGPAVSGDQEGEEVKTPPGPARWNVMARESVDIHYEVYFLKDAPDIIPKWHFVCLSEDALASSSIQVELPSRGKPQSWFNQKKLLGQ